MLRDKGDRVVNIPRILREYFAAVAAIRTKRLVPRYERQRIATMARMADRKAKHGEWKPMLSELKRATCASMAASMGREWRH